MGRAGKTVEHNRRHQIMFDHVSQQTREHKLEPVPSFWLLEMSFRRKEFSDLIDSLKNNNFLINRHDGYNQFIISHHKEKFLTWWLLSNQDLCATVEATIKPYTHNTRKKK